jgi:hypothetical protein
MTSLGRVATTCQIEVGRYAAATRERESDSAPVSDLLTLDNGSEHQDIEAGLDVLPDLVSPLLDQMIRRQDL